MTTPSSAITKPIEALSHVVGDASLSLSEITIPQFFSLTKKLHGKQLAAVFCAENIRWTWDELGVEIDKLAAGLIDIGIVRGDRVGIWSPNRSEWLLTQFATARIGAILVNINPAYRLSELEYALNKVQMKAIVIAESFKGSDYITMMQTLGAEKLPHLKTIIKVGNSLVDGMLNFADVMTKGKKRSDIQLDEISNKLNAHDAINIQFTSGTTGNPKGATLSHYNIVNNSIAVAKAMRLTQQDKLCIPVPLYHCFGMVLGVLACVSNGSAMVFPSEGFDPISTLKAVSTEHCTALHGVPTMFIAQLEHADFAKFSMKSLRTGIMAGAPCPITTMKRVVADMGMSEITIAYGMTETSPVSFQSAVDDSLEKRVSTVGRVLPHLEVKIIDEQGQTVKVGQKGELCTKGYSVMKGYWDEPERTAESIQEGWMHTGDLATIDEQGFCNIVGRVKDMLIRGGENVFPREVEEYLFRHPKIQEVQVFGVPDEKYGEQVACWIVLKPNQTSTELEIREFCQGQIAHFKIPHYVRFVSQLPMTVTGKPQKFVMREAMIRELGISVAKTA
jgi:fatty-acyl-CoA synthase